MLYGMPDDRDPLGATAAFPRDARTHWAYVLLTVIGVIALGAFALREYMDANGGYLAAPDYQAEMLPALAGLRERGLAGYLDHLPGYPGAVMVELLPAQFATWIGAGEAATWRIISWFGIGVLGLAILAAVALVRDTDASPGAVRTAILLAAASPAAYWALRIGHPEEVMSTGLLLGAAIAAARERPIIAGVLLGLAVGKAWPAAAALPVLGLLLPDPLRVAKGMLAAVVAAAVIYVPPLLFASDSVQVLSDLGTNGIFNVGQVFWWFGSPIPEANLALQTVPQPRVGPAWPGELSHPLVLGVGTAIGLMWCATLFGRLSREGRVSALRTDGRTRSREETAQLAGAALLVMAGILYARCFLDTWNVPYYLLPALVLGALGEMLTGRRPIITLVATGLMWKWHAPGDLTVRSDPDVYTALYLSWTIPFCIAFLSMGFRAARGVRAEVPAEVASQTRSAPEGSTTEPDAPTPSTSGPPPEPGAPELGLRA